MNLRLPSREALASFFKTGLLIMSASLLLTIVLKTSPELRAASGGTLSSGKVFSSGNGAASNDEPIRQISTESPRVVLTFNTALQEPETVTELLTILQEQNTSAVFFLSDAWIKKYPEEVKTISSAGHEIGYLLEGSGEALAAGTSEITKLAGTRCCYFRPALGEYDTSILSEAKNEQLSCILWNLDSQDWKDYDREALTSFLLQHQNLAPGSILLFRCGTKHLAEALPFIIQGLRDMGYEPATLSSLLRDGA